MGTALNNVAKLRNGFDVTEPRFGAKGDGTTDDTAAIQAAIDAAAAAGGGTVIFPRRSTAGYLVSATLRIRTSYIALLGDGINTVITRNNGTFGDTLLVGADDPTAATLFDVNVSNLKFNSTAAMTSGAHVEFVEAAYCTIENLSIQNGFIGLHLRGLRASNVDKIHIRSGQLYGSVQAGSRFCLIEDSPRALSTSENVEVFFSNFNFTTNGSAYIEHGLEVKEADGIWFDNGHIRGASVANCFLNAQSTPQLLGLKFNNVWFDGATTRCLLMDNSTSNYAGFYVFTGCSFTGGTTHGVDIATGATMDTVLFSGCQTWSIDAATAWSLNAGDNIVIDGCTFKTLNAGAAATGSAISIGSAVNSVTVSGGSIKDSPNLTYGIVNNGTAKLAVNGMSFLDMGASAKPVHLVNPATTNYASSGCLTDQSTGYVLGNMQQGEFVSVADDTAVSVSLGEVFGGVLAVSLKLNTSSTGLIAFETFDPSTIAIIAGGANLEVATGVLSGTTGTDTKLTVSVTDAGVLYFENRTGVERNIVWKLLSRDRL